MKSLITLMVIFTAVTFTFSQSGYEGKTVYIAYQNLSNANLGENPLYDRTKVYGLNMAHELSLHKVISRRHDIYPFYRFSRSGLFDYYSGNYSNNYREDFYKLTRHTVGLGLRIFNKNSMSWHLAPIGTYVDLKPYVSVIQSEIEDVPTAIVEDITNAGISLGIGRQQVIFNTMTFNIGIEFNLPFKLASVITSSEIEDAIQTRYIYKSVFQVNMGLGFLAF